MPRSLWILIIGMTINVMASSFLWPLNTIFLYEYLGKSLSVAGMVLMINALANVIGNLLGGHSFDKYGGYITVLAGASITLIASIGMMVNHTYIPYVVFLAISGFGAGLMTSAIFAMAGSVWKEGGRKAFNAIYVAQNLGIALGSALGGAIAFYSFEYVFWANAGIYSVFLLVVIFGFKGINSDVAIQVSVRNEEQPKINIKMLYALGVLCFGYFLCWVGYVQWQSTIAAYTQTIGITLKQYSYLWTVNGALIVLAQPLLALVIKWFVKTLKAQMIVGMIIFVLSYAIAANATNFKGFVVAIIILTVGEMFVWPAVPAIADALAVKGKEGLFQGIVNSTATGGRMVGPLLGGFIVDTQGMNMMFMVCLVMIVIATGTVFVYGMMSKKENKPYQAPIQV